MSLFLLSKPQHSTDNCCLGLPAPIYRGQISLIQNTGDWGAWGILTMGHSDRGRDQPHTEYRRMGSRGVQTLGHTDRGTAQSLTKYRRIRSK